MLTWSVRCERPTPLSPGLCRSCRIPPARLNAPPLPELENAQIARCNSIGMIAIQTPVFITSLESQSCKLPGSIGNFASFESPKARAVATIAAISPSLTLSQGRVRDVACGEHVGLLPAVRSVGLLMIWDMVSVFRHGYCPARSGSKEALALDWLLCCRSHRATACNHRCVLA